MVTPPSNSLEHRLIVLDLVWRSPLSTISWSNFLSVRPKVSITPLLGTFLLAGLFCIVVEVL